MVDLRRTSFIIAFIIGAYLVTPLLAWENSPAPELKIEANNLPTFPKDEEIVLVIDGAVVKSEADTRVETLSHFLKAKGSPLAPYADAFVQVADKYQLDYRFLPAIAGLESAWGKALRPSTHNPFGWGPHLPFPSFPAAFEAVGSGIRTRYVRSGKVTPSIVGPKYASSPTWASRVTSFMLAIDKSPI
jgi:hypothetical protein